MKTGEGSGDFARAQQSAATVRRSTATFRGQPGTRERKHRRKSGAAMKTLGQFLIERRKARGLSQKEFAVLIKNRDGKPISATYPP